MVDEILIDNKTHKIMNYVYMKDEVKLSVIEKKFGTNGINALCYLCNIKYAIYRKPDGELTYDINSTHFDGSFGLMPQGNKFVENKRESFFHWFIPILISCISAAISLLAIAISIFSNNQEIFVHIIK